MTNTMNNNYTIKANNDTRTTINTNTSDNTHAGTKCWIHTSYNTTTGTNTNTTNKNMDMDHGELGMYNDKWIVNNRLLMMAS